MQLSALLKVFKKSLCHCKVCGHQIEKAQCQSFFAFMMNTYLLPEIKKRFTTKGTETVVWALLYFISCFYTIGFTIISLIFHPKRYALILFHSI